MELEFEKREIPYAKPVLHQLQFPEQNQEIRLSDGMPDVGRILAAWGQLILRGKEWHTGAVSCSAGVMVWVLYQPEGEGEIRTLESWIPFQVKWDVEDGGREGDMRIQLLLRSVDARSVSPRKVMVRCAVGALGEAWQRDSFHISVPGKVEEDIQLLVNRYPMQLPKIAGEKPFHMDEELTLPVSIAQPDSIIAYTLTPRVTDVRILTDKLVFQAVAQLHLVYLSEEGRISSWNQELPVSQYAQLDMQMSPDARGDVRIAVTSLELEQNPEGRLNLKCGAVAQYLAEDREMVELVEDAYSTRRNLEMKFSQLELPLVLEQKQMAVPVAQSLREQAVDIADVTYLPDFPQLHRGDGVSLELPGQFQVLYYGPDGELKSAGARTEESRSFPAGENSRLEAAVLPGLPPTATAGSGIELKAEEQLSLRSVFSGSMPMVTSLRLGEESQDLTGRPSLILRRKGDASLWQIAKENHATVQRIQDANGPEIKENQILLIPVS